MPRMPWSSVTNSTDAPIAVAPALVVETQHNVARLGEDASILRQIDAAHAGIAVAQHDASAPLAGLDVRWQQRIARELDASL